VDGRDHGTEHVSFLPPFVVENASGAVGSPTRNRMEPSMVTKLSPWSVEETVSRLTAILRSRRPPGVRTRA